MVLRLNRLSSRPFCSSTAKDKRSSWHKEKIILQDVLSRHYNWVCHSLQEFEESGMTTDSLIRNSVTQAILGLFSQTLESLKWR